MRILVKVVKIFLGTVYVLCLGEAFVRCFAPQSIMPRFVTGAPYGIRTNISGAHYKHYTGDVTVEYRINWAGFRADVEYKREKPKGTCRILMFGDSFMIGSEVNLKHTIPYRLEKRLSGAGKPCEVINMAVAGFGTAEMLIALQENGLSYEPDIVVFQWHFSDLDDNVRSDLYRLVDNRLERGQKTYLPAIGIRDFLQTIGLYRLLNEHSQLFHAARESLAVQAKRALVEMQASAATNERNDPHEQHDGSRAPAATAYRDKSRYPARLAARLLQEAHQLAKAHNFAFYVLDIPKRREGGRARSSIRTLGLKDLEGINIITYDATLNRLQKDGFQTYYQKGHGHFTPLGYSVAANELFRAIARDPSYVKH